MRALIDKLDNIIEFKAEKHDFGGYELRIMGYVGENFYEQTFKTSKKDLWIELTRKVMDKFFPVKYEG